jgi:hypothetical protein
MPNAGGRGYYRDAYTTRELVALRDEAWPLLSSVERRAIHFDVRAGVAAGRVPLALALSFVPRLLLADDRYSVAAALATPLGLDAWVPDAQRAKYEYWLRTAFGPAAAAAGFTVESSDSFDTETGRRALLEAVAWVARDPALVAEAVRLAADWRDLPQSLRGLVLQLAVDGDAATFDKALADVRVEPDRVRRRELYAALAAVRDPARQRRVLALVLDPALDVRETVHILFGASTAATVTGAQAFFRAHQAELIDRLPKDATRAGVGALSALFTRTCRADKRDDVAAYVTRELAHYPGARRLVDQSIEAMDQCIAKRARLEPALRAWLSGIKLPKGWNRS